MTKIEVIPESITHWSYGMMAPYQGDTSWSADFRYEGKQPDGTWEEIDMAYYMPYGFGERNVRKFLRVYQYLGPAGHREKFAEIARQVLEREQARGKPYTAVRVWFEQWDRSPAGFEFLRTPLFMTREIIAEVQQ